MEENSKHLLSDTSREEKLDFKKLGLIIRKSWYWIIAFFVLSITVSYLYIRWTKPLYESYSEIKLDIETEASEFGIGGFFEEKNLSILSGEIELLKSSLFYKKVIDSMNLFVSYHTQGRLLSDEKYPEHPFSIEYQLKNDSWLDRPIFIDFINDSSFQIIESEPPIAGTLSTDRWIDLKDLKLRVTRHKNIKLANDESYYFIIHSYQALENYFSKNLVVELQNLQANTIRISFTDHNPIKARNLVNAINAIYIDYTQTEKSLTNNKKIDWINNQLDIIEKELSGYEDYFEDFTLENRTNDIDEDLRKTIILINQIDSSRLEINTLLAVVSETEKQLSTNSTLSPYRGYNTEINKVIEEYNDLKFRRQELGLSYKETTFAIRELDQEIENKKQLLTDQIERFSNNLKKDLNRLVSQRNRLESEFTKIPEKNTELKKNQRFYDLYETFYLSLMQSKAEFEIAVAGLTPNFKILNVASTASSPIYPKKLIIYGIGFISGLFLSIIYLGFRYLLEDKVNSIEEIEAILPFTLIGAVPKSRTPIKKDRLVVQNASKSGISESLRTIRTNMQFLIPQKGPKVITVTSSVGGEGKTFICLNFGAILSASKKKVIILDLDMRKPQIHQSLKKEAQVENEGLSTILINQSDWKNCVNQTEIDGMDYISSGPIPPNPSELLLNGEFDNLIESLKAVYDIIILDTPPVGLVTDAMLAMKRSDLNLIVVKAGYTRKQDAKNIRRNLKLNKNLKISVILNNVERSAKYGYNYGYYTDKNK